MMKTLDIATAFVKGEGVRWCPKCGTELELSQKDPWHNGVFCPICGSSYSWQHWAHFGEAWLWDENNTGLVSFRGDDEEVDIPYHCTKICSFAFSVSDATAVRIPDSVKIIEPHAFANAGKLKHVTLPQGLERIEAGTFMGCDKLKHITIPKTVKYIGKDAFSGCSSLQSVCFPDGLAVIDAGAFSGTGLVELKLSGVALLGERAFAQCPYLHNISLKAKHIGNACFAECRALHSVKLSEGVLTIGKKAFHRCTSLSGIHVPASVYEFGNQAFAGIPKIEAQLPKQLEEFVKNYRFYRAIIEDEKYYIFEESAKLRYYEGGV